MIDWMKSVVSDVQLNSAIAIWLYWIPLVVCMFFSIKEFVKLYKKDVELRAKSVANESWFKSDVTIGILIVHIVAPFFPVYNIICAAYKITNSLILITNILNWPLIPAYNPSKK